MKPEATRAFLALCAGQATAQVEGERDAPGTVPFGWGLPAYGWDLTVRSRDGVVLYARHVEQRADLQGWEGPYPTLRQTPAGRVLDPQAAPEEARPPYDLGPWLAEAVYGDCGLLVAGCWLEVPSHALRAFGLRFPGRLLVLPD